jgi:hypothetical protein
MAVGWLGLCFRGGLRRTRKRSGSGRRFVEGPRSLGSPGGADPIHLPPTSRCHSPSSPGIGVASLLIEEDRVLPESYPVPAFNIAVPFVSADPDDPVRVLPLKLDLAHVEVIVAPELPSEPGRAPQRNP